MDKMSAYTPATKDENLNGKKYVLLKWGESWG